MRPKELILHNIGPFTGEHTVNFDSLGSLFLIYGQTGAGKTTLFDAISYAFYGKPLGGRSGVMRNLRSHFADDYAVSDVILTFFIGAQLYRIKRQLPYTKEGRKLETPEEVSLECYENGSWENRSSTNKRETDASIQNLIKLSDKEFSRIVLLPQGEFAQFLRAQSSDKKETLMHLFPIKRYSDLMQEAKLRADTLQQEAHTIEANLKTLHTRFVYHRYESDRAELLNEIDRIRDEHGSVLTALQKKNTELEQEKILAEKRKELERVTEELEAYRIREEDIRNLKAKIEKAQRAAPLAVHVNQLLELEAACAADERQIREKRERMEELTARMNTLQERHSEITAKEQQRDSLYAVIDSLRKAAVLEQEIGAEQAEEGKLKRTAAAAQAQLQHIEAQLAAVTEKTAAIAPAVDVLDEREHAYRSLQIRLDIEKQLHDMLCKQEQLTTFLHSYAQAADNARTQLAEIAHDCDIQTEQINRIEEEKKAAERQRAAAALAEHLEEGSPCPVCGSVHHPAPAQGMSESAFSFDERIEAAKRSTAKLQHEKEKAQTALAGAEASYTNYQKQIDERAAAAADLQLRYKECSAVPFPERKDAAECRIKETAQQINEAVQAYNASRKAFAEQKTLEEEVRRLQRERQECTQQHHSAEQRLSGVSAALQEKRRQFDQAFSQLPENLRSIQLSADTKILDKQRTDGRSKAYDIEVSNADIPDASSGKTAPEQYDISDAETALEQCEALLQELKLTINAYHTDVSEATQNLERIRGELFAAETHGQERAQQRSEKTSLLQAAYIKEGFADLEDLQQAVCSEPEVAQWKTEIDTFYEQYAAYKQAAAGLEKDVTATEPRDLDELETAVEALRQRYDEIQARLEVLNAEKAKLEELYAQHTELTKALAVKTAEAQNWVALAKDLCGSNPRKLQFDTWILSAFLHEVTVFANKRLERMSEGRYRLAVSEEHGAGNAYRGLDLEIADAYTGKCRPSATLSGGETFMASISLALGLADSIQARAGGIRIDSMFIDEGFGSLDEKALENAVSILDEIRGNRMVGIISHVGELQSRIPQKIEVIKTGTGSSIRQGKAQP
ncbi:SbcC/MukB-like Walker B domain-containing protein [Treponema sp. OMZ 857]|uniref:SbcC/MukB-like Walker B domain-containing protein n=2 Tax=unclassified Treponema TaxID=2638727 RepID=UPI0020A2F502|nr:SbcC/MukB-like Walker B domain-containing protein [Treponema sp. OMZ 857]UTC44559.1 AAA family ATPase [Treponema sp. OMZ 857]